MKRGEKINILKKRVKLVINRNYTEMHGQRNIKWNSFYVRFGILTKVLVKIQILTACYAVPTGKLL
jgi:hypothetical protein